MESERHPALQHSVGSSLVRTLQRGQCIDRQRGLLTLVDLMRRHCWFVCA